MPFPLDRLLAIMGVLLEEYDSEEHLHLGNLPGAETELELQRAGVYGAVRFSLFLLAHEALNCSSSFQITQLASSRLLFRTSHSERLDGPPAYRCGVGYTSALALSKDLGIILGDLMWETS
jgi:origin recognition complex subunit 5